MSYILFKDFFFVLLKDTFSYTSPISEEKLRHVVCISCVRFTLKMDIICKSCDIIHTTMKMTKRMTEQRVGGIMFWHLTCDLFENKWMLSWSQEALVSCQQFFNKDPLK